MPVAGQRQRHESVTRFTDLGGVSKINKTKQFGIPISTLPVAMNPQTVSTIFVKPGRPCRSPAQRYQSAARFNDFRQASSSMPVAGQRRRHESATRFNDFRRAWLSMSVAGQRQRHGSATRFNDFG